MSRAIEWERTWKMQVYIWVPCNSHLVHGLRQPIGSFDTLPPNLRDDWFWSSGWGSYGECTSVYGYILDTTYGESDIWLLGSHDLTKLLYYMVSQPWEDTRPMLKFFMTLT